MRLVAILDVNLRNEARMAAFLSQCIRNKSFASKWCENVSLDAIA